MSGIDKIVNAISTALEKARVPFIPLPAILLMCSVFKRPGLSDIATASRIIRAQSEFDAPTGVLPDGTPNKMNAYTYRVVREIFNEIRDNSVMQGVVPPGSIIFEGVGIGPTGSVKVSGTNANPVKVTGQLQ